MSTKSLGPRARQLLGGLALSAVAVAAQADPFSLQGACVLTSIVAGQGQCQMEYSLSDLGFTASIRIATVRIDNILVHRYLNDNVNPTLNSIYAVSGVTAVSCGVSHVVTTYIVRIAMGSPVEKVGSLPGILCPTAP